MKIKEQKEEVSHTFIWKVRLSELKNSRNYSDTSTVGGLKCFKIGALFFFEFLYSWILDTPNNLRKWSCRLLHVQGYVMKIPVEQLSMYLAVADASGLPVGWSRLAHSSFTLVNQLDSKKSIAKSTKGTVLFNENQCELGFKSFVPASELYDRIAGYLMSNMCIIKAKVATLQDTPASEPFCTTVATPIVRIEDPGTEIASKKESNREEPSNVNSGASSSLFSSI
ncbi:ubiquitin C-terminal hydrolase 13-like [Rosa rugosa]|uniref:ubiquitin C-terminal hydrolase 13-like n=1 Tax=Rosa rugosa TaxID=74645 RepID=UPI002B410152|nr:ubiquitin C-terminal hydrolase 13-like [Rosa rugosa]